MEISKVDIATLYNLGGVANLTVYKDIDFLDNGKVQNLPAILIVPGGGYGFVSLREGTPVAAEFLAKGFVPFILTYSVREEDCYPQQLNELAASVDYIRKNAYEFGINPDKIYLIGFSAGGHLVANLGVEYPSLTNYDAKPNGVCLSYPVISADYGVSGNTYINLLSKYSGEEKELLLKKLSFTHSDLSLFPPAFIWTTATDDCVMSQNSLVFASKLVEANRKCELHMYPEGRHGLSVANTIVNEELDYLPTVRGWVELCINFFKSL